MDVTKFMNWFLDMFLNIMKTIFNTLDNIKFSGISFLDYMIAIFILMPVLTILFTLATSNKLWNANEEKRRKKDSDD